MILTACPNCRRRFQAPESLANKRVKCPQCQAPFTVPSPTISSSLSSIVWTGPTDGAVAETVSRLVFGPSRGWRFLSSPWVVMTFLFGFLPWCEVSCNNRDIDFHLSQSGYQALYGGVSAPPVMEEMLARQSEQTHFAQNMHQSKQGLRKQLGIERSYLANVSPFLVFFWGANLALIGIICFVPLGSWRLGFALSLCGVLLGVLVLHACLGLPLERRTREAIAEAVREDPSERMLLLMVFKSGKTVWFWLTLASVILLTLTEPLLNWLRAERWGNWLAPSIITGGAAGLMLMAAIVQFAVRETIVGNLENHLTILSKAEEEKQAKAEAEQQRREGERQAEIRRHQAEAERFRQQAAFKAEEARLEEQRRLRERAEDERRRQNEREQEERRARRERQQREAEAKRKADQEAKEEAEQEAARKADLEKKGLAYYPRPRTSYNGRTADEWANMALRSLINYRAQTEAAEALEQLKEEGMPYLLVLLQKQKTLLGRKAVLQRIQGEYIHPNDLKKLLPYLERDRELERNRDFVLTRVLALRCLHKQARHLKSLLPEIEANLKDLLIISIYKEEIRNVLDDIRDRTK